MKTALYSFITCSLFVFVVIQCDSSSPTQPNGSEVVGQGWKDSLIVDLYSAYVATIQNDSSRTITFTSKGQSLLNQNNFVFDSFGFALVVPKYRPSRFCGWVYYDGSTLGISITPQDTNTVYTVNYNDQSEPQQIIIKNYINPSIATTSLDYIQDKGFNLRNFFAGNLGTLKIYYE